ncbi:MAG: HEAT repeat domain-containing protein [Candidatus Kapabacteria bacterium]|nr:HEAT repeat domain-containing protein [Candidatus Kapabacteria bacterium]
MKTAENIHKFGEIAIPKLLALLKVKDEYIKYRAVRTLELYDNLSEKYLDDMGDALINGELWLAPYVAKIGSDKAVNILIEAIKRNKEQESTLTHSFEKLGSKCIPALIQLLECNVDCDESLLYTVSTIFGFLEKDAISAVPLLDSLAISKNNSITSRKFSIVSLGNIGIYAQTVDKDLYKVWENENQLFSKEVTTALLEMKSPLASELYENKLIQADSTYDKILALRDLSSLGFVANKAGKTILKFLNDEDWDLRVAAARTVGFIDYKPAIPELEKLLYYENDWRLNYVSILSLEMLQAGEAIPHLKNIESNHWYSLIREAARKTILKLTDSKQETNLNIYSTFGNYFFNYESDGNRISNCIFEGDINQNRLACWNGTLIGEDKGEWGGSLKFIYSNGKHRSLIDDNIHAIYNFNNNIIVLAGSAHLDINRGIVYKLHRVANHILVTKILILPGAPISLKKINVNEIMIATIGGTVILSKDLKLRQAICK